MMLRQQQQQHVSVCTTLSVDTISAVGRQIHGCETCSDHANLPFAQLLLRLIGHGEWFRDYTISDDVHCPSCLTPLDIDTLVETQQGIGCAAAMRSSSAPLAVYMRR